MEWLEFLKDAPNSVANIALVVIFLKFIGRRDAAQISVQKEANQILGEVKVLLQKRNGSGTPQPR